MGCSIQWIKEKVGIIRHHPNGGKFGDSYDWFCVVEKDEQLAILHGSVDLPASIRDAIVTALVDDGFTEVKWYRIKKGWVRFKLQRLGSRVLVDVDKIEKLIGTETFNRYPKE